MRVNDKGFSKKQIITISAIVLVLLAVLIAILVYRSQIRATTMRLLRIEGTVTMEENGRLKDIRENARLKSGNAIDTSVQSLASIGLDDYKVVTLDEVSRAEFNQQGKYLNLNLKKGSLFFEVDKPLADDETFEIETSTMIVGIRGTSGWVSVAGENESLIVTDGHVHVIGTNPVTGEVKEIDVSAGQRVTVYLYNDREVDSIMFELEDITERDLPDFVLDRLRENPELLDRVINATGWDKEWILGEEVTDLPEEPENSDSDSQQPAVSASEEPSEKPSEPETDAVADLTDVDGNDNNPAPIESFAPVEKPSPSALDVMKEEALKHVVSDNADGTYTLDDGTVFDPEYYAERYPDVVEAYGTDREALLAHYLLSGKDENRYVSQQDEDDKLLQEAIARLPEDEPESSPSASATPSPAPAGPRYSNTTAAYLLCNGNDFTLADGSTTGSFDGTTFSITHAANTTVTLPKEIYWNDAEYVLDLDNVDIQSSIIDTVDASNVNPTLREMYDLADRTPSQQNGSHIHVDKTNVSVYDGNVANSGQWYGLVANVSNVTPSEFLEISKEVTSSGLYGINYGDSNSPFGVYGYDSNTGAYSVSYYSILGSVTFNQTGNQTYVVDQCNMVNPNSTPFTNWTLDSTGFHS